MENRREDLGKIGKDVITGFSGTITAVACYITGCDQYCITADAKDNYTEVLSGWYDVNRVELSDHKEVTIPTDESKGAMNPPEAYR